MLLADGQRSSEMVSSEIVSKIITPKPNSLEASNSIQKIFSGLWYTRVEDWLRVS